MSGAAADFFGPGGRLSAAHDAFEDRPGQVAMAEAVERTLADGGRLMVEAGTGTGKTLAYLVPAVVSGRPVVVSTGTRNLQDQIFRKDLPFLKDRLGMTISACLMKGRENYLCRFKLAEFEREPLIEVRDEARWIPVLSRWSRRTGSGDRAEIADLPDDLRLWRDINARADTCTGSRCPEYEACWLTRLKRAAQQAQILVVNHHLFFADLAVRSAFGAVLPDYDTVIFDEAHLIEEIATGYFGLQVSAGQIEELGRDAERLAASRGGGARGGGGAAALREAGRGFFDVLRDATGEAIGRQRFDPPERGGPDLSVEWEVLRRALEEVGRSAASNAADAESIQGIDMRAESLRQSLELVLERTRPGFVYGLEARGRSNVIASASPIDVSGLLREQLFERLQACVLTSATLAVAGSFSFFVSRLGLEDTVTLVVDSPFDHERQAVLYLPTGMPEPRHPGFVPRAVDQMRRLLEITRGRAFLLFTSHANLQRARAELERDGTWPLFVQGEGSKAALVEAFRMTPGAVLLGTTSFWHGVDVPGEALSLVVIDKLPFDVPGDPLVAARIERIRETGGNPFVEYQTPLAVLDLKQGLGRLLRSRADRGVLAVLDPRLTTRPYGKTFLSSLPPYPVVRTLDACARFFAGDDPPS